MKHLWKLLLILGVVLIAVKLLIALLIPAGVVLIILGGLLYLQDRQQAPKVIKG